MSIRLLQSIAVPDLTEFFLLASLVVTAIASIWGIKKVIKLLNKN